MYAEAAENHSSPLKISDQSSMRLDGSPGSLDCVIMIDGITLNIGRCRAGSTVYAIPCMFDQPLRHPDITEGTAVFYVQFEQD